MVEVRTVSEHLRGIYDTGELEEGATIRKFRIVRTDACKTEREEHRKRTRLARHQVWAELYGKCGADDRDGGWAEIEGVKTICSLDKGHEDAHESLDGVRWTSRIVLTRLKADK